MDSSNLTWPTWRVTGTSQHHEGHSGASLRLHIWNPPGHELPHQETINELHTHVFDMHSTIVRGKMNQRIFTFAVGSEWHSTAISVTGWVVASRR